MEQALNNWAEMYNKKDKEHFQCQLKLAQAENKLKQVEQYANSLLNKEIANKLLDIIGR